MTLSSSDEQVFTRCARRHYDDTMIGKTIASAKLRAYVASGQRPETYLLTSPPDGAERLISLQRIFDRPLLAAPANLYFSVGMPAAPTLAGSGHGMANMRLCARKLGATLAWLDAGGEAPRPGMVVELVVPLNKASQKGENPRADPRVSP
jgi:hypothetical protein